MGARLTATLTRVDLPELVQPYAEFLGTWRGEGVGGYPTIAEDFRFGEQIVFECFGKPIIAFTSRSWSLDDDRPLARQSGFWRPTSPTELEVVLAVASGVVEVYYGRLVDGPAGQHVEIESDFVGRTRSAKDVTAEKRMYAIRGGQLMYAADMAAVGETMHPHLSASLSRV